jgi:hypothetical protein
VGFAPAIFRVGAILKVIADLNLGTKVLGTVCVVADDATERSLEDKGIGHGQRVDNEEVR